MLDRIAEHGIPDRAVAEKALRSTLTVLGQRLMDDEALALAACLPEELARFVEQSEYSRVDGDFNAAEFYDRVRRRARSSVPVAHEQVDVVMRVVGELLDPALRRRLDRGLPEPIGRRLHPPEFGAPSPHGVATSSPPISTLAHGRPGSRHPLSEGRPREGQTHSVAVNADPHGETKLSSSRGLTQERHRESLATGRPPSPDRSLSEADDE